MLKQRTQPRRVNWTANVEDLDCAILAACGIYSWKIAEITGLTICQVNYRITAAKIKKRDFYTGMSPLAKAVISQATPMGTNTVDVVRDTISDLRETIKDHDQMPPKSCRRPRR